MNYNNKRLLNKANGWPYNGLAAVKLIWLNRIRLKTITEYSGSNFSLEIWEYASLIYAISIRRLLSMLDDFRSCKTHKQEWLNTLTKHEF